MIRLQRIGRKNDPAFRMAVLPKTAGPKAGKYVDLVGTYNPKTKAMTVNGERIKEWIAKGAQVSPSLSNLLIDKGVIEGKKVNVLPKKTRIVKEVAAEPEAPAEETAPVEEGKEEPAEAPAAAEETSSEEVPAETPSEAPEETPADQPVEAEEKAA